VSIRRHRRRATRQSDALLFPRRFERPLFFRFSKQCDSAPTWCTKSADSRSSGKASLTMSFAVCGFADSSID